MAKGSALLFCQSQTVQRRDSRALLVRKYRRAIRRLVGESDSGIRDPQLKMRHLDRRQDIRLGILLPKDDMPSEKERRLFFEQFGRQHSFLLRSWWSKFTVVTPEATHKLPFESLP